LWWLAQTVASGFWVVGLVALFYNGVRPSPVPIGFLLAGTLVQWAVYVIGPIVTTTQKGNGPIIDLSPLVEKWDIPVGVVIGLFLQLAVLPLIYIPIGWLFDTNPGETAEDLVASVDSPLTVVLLLLLVVVGAPLFEEFFYRGFLLRGLLGKFAAWPAILLSSAAFALVHIKPILFPGTFVLGVVTAYSVVRTERLGPAWAMHLGFNLATAVVLLVL